jgi:soluble lytic murein transglycosylase-like protein
MKNLPITVALFLAAGWLALPAHGQLSSYVDERGNVVYTNADSPAARKAEAEKNAAAADAKAKAEQASAKQAAADSNALPGALPKSINPDVLHQIVQETAQKHDVDPALVSAVISTESNWNTSALSRKGAQGLMQLVPETAQKLGVYNAWDPQQNIDGGVRYLHMLLDRYNGDLPKALAAYNAGPSAVDRWGGVPNYPETQEYVRKVTHTYFQPGSANQSGSRAGSRPIYRFATDDGRVIFTNE